ncbi:MobF family relaxase [Tautonia rosea]|uniref:MobF family relaxase n=1 Tax=Tautonia rosea TaxID=2728037 RepID=UPI001473FDAF|nr:MobF family relaxase [Tautonia rosea]
MLRIIQNRSAAGAKSYYSTADYFVQGQELAGRWRGRGARLLGLDGEVGRADWESLCDNRHPRTGAALTMRTKDRRTVGYDINFHVPKSVSVIHGLTGEGRILDAFRTAVRRTMDDIEAEAQARVRKGRKDADRTTGNLVWGEFLHFTSRPVDGIPDPHLHAHCFAFNATWDREEGAWKAAQFRGIKRDAPYFQAVFHSHMARLLAEHGYAIRRAGKGWEVDGVPERVIAAFSRRRDVIERVAREEGISDDASKDRLGARTRERKARELPGSLLLSEWRSRITPEDRDGLDRLARAAVSHAGDREGRAAAEAMEHAVQHCFERRSVVPERTLFAEALRHSVGRASVAEILGQAKPEGLVVGTVEGRRMATTADILAEERRMVEFARAGRGTRKPLGDPARPSSRQWLNEDQRRAVQHVLGSRDRVIMIRGAAGVGKTTLMREAAEGIREGGREVHVFAPTAGASRGVLRGEGFDSADTVARLLVDRSVQPRTRGQVIWIDEAGLLGSRTMARVFDLAARNDARVVLSGDRRQHKSVERGSPLHLLEEEAGILPAEVRDIRRQRGAYREAIAAMGEGRAGEGFDRLDELGWIREIGDAERYRLLASDYVEAVRAGESSLVVSPTHLEKDRITGEIRRLLSAEGLLDGDSHVVPVLIPRKLTLAEKADPAEYQPGDVIQFHQNAPGFRRGQRLQIGPGPAPTGLAGRFEVFHRGSIMLAPGDMIRITRNGATADRRHALHNGDLHRVRGFDSDGALVLANGWKVARDYGHIDHGYVVTSHAAQGKTVDRVFVGQSASSLAATSREQFYVSCSRGRKAATVYTDDKATLRASLMRSEQQLMGRDLLANGMARRSLRSRRREREEQRKKLDIRLLIRAAKREREKEHER